MRINQKKNSLKHIKIKKIHLRKAFETQKMYLPDENFVEAKSNLVMGWI
jgi:hypothetical protein